MKIFLFWLKIISQNYIVHPYYGHHNTPVKFCGSKNNCTLTARCGNEQPFAFNTFPY